MPIILNAIYGLLLLIALPALAWRSWKTGRYRRHLRAKLVGTHLPVKSLAKPIWFHGVSVGEIHLLRTVVAAFQKRHPQIPLIISSTTDTGLAEARKCFPDIPVLAWPFDFSWAVNRTLRSLTPQVVILAESELWPNFLHAANRMQIPVLVVNGRMSPRSTRRVRKFARLVKPLLYNRVGRFLMQTEEYAANLVSIGIPAIKITVTGSVKYDGALKILSNSASLGLRDILGISEEETVLVAGSTHAPEEEILLAGYRNLKSEFPNLRLVLVPRSPERFEAVANLVNAFQLPLVRRSCGLKSESNEEVILIDTLGELSAVWGFAHLGYVGGSFDGQRGGQSMIEPAGYGVPTLFGPHIWNFRDTVQRLLACGGAIKLESPDGLETQLRQWLQNPELRISAGKAARALIESQQGATQKTIDEIERYCESNPARRQAA
ncbi:3-deoxy-D-manno-octulosonic acid transferase [Telmatocola sphagniphila]|uniref:3-deoxy-D-manno-octulosonic acid transferase n=1 Tax=Telmatocola sphagniphila TaxID=1123043 RepID=A0A8E6EU75_9BACT|nr:3-deoxy-D-manno-octulosonic acid transferase [Telmatocola sphagniphila]QVL33364.1 3-deoxy-D-manno-octulosonic acid transferase [Telmatocola sphagniphila]